MRELEPLESLDTQRFSACGSSWFKMIFISIVI
nr:MAG TPA: hypothetical protein [Caudoviricetes sp.]